MLAFISQEQGRVYFTIKEALDIACDPKLEGSDYLLAESDGIEPALISVDELKTQLSIYLESKCQFEAFLKHRRKLERRKKHTE